MTVHFSFAVAPKPEENVSLFQKYAEVLHTLTGAFSEDNPKGSRDIRLYENQVRINTTYDNQTAIRNNLYWLSDRRCYVLKSDPRYPALDIENSAHGFIRIDRNLFSEYTLDDYSDNDIVINTCPESGRLFLDGYGVYLDSRDMYVSPSYFRESEGFRCEGCGDNFLGIDEHFRFGGYCDSCGDARVEEEEEDLSLSELLAEMQGYDLCPIDTHGFNGHDVENNRYFGVELEFEASDYPNDFKDKKEIEALLGSICAEHWCFTNDGSLDDGIELKTAPAGFDTHRQQFNRIFKEGSWLNKKFFTNVGTGMHVHVTRQSIKHESTLIKIQNFLAQPNNRPFLDVIGGRGENERYARRKAKITFRRGNSSVVVRTDCKYYALNLSPISTIEFRLFKATKKVNEFMSRLQFCDALIEWFDLDVTGHGIASSKKVLYPEFVLWLLKERKTRYNRWKELYDFIETIGVDLVENYSESNSTTYKEVIRIKQKDTAKLNHITKTIKLNKERETNTQCA